MASTRPDNGPATDIPAGSDSADDLNAVRYRMRRSIGARTLGLGCIVLAVAVVVAFGGMAFESNGGTTAGWVAGILAVPGAGLILAGGLSLLDRRARLRLDAAGMVNRTWFTVGARRIGWDEIGDIASPDGRPGVLVVTLRDGRSSVIYAAMLDTAASEVEAQIRTRANRALGYRPLS